jgi:hypothetical protein
VGEIEPRLPIASSETRLFLCECGRPDCMEYIEVDLETVRLFFENGWPMIVPEHQLSRAAEARARGAELREQAQALQAQAGHQVARAHRNADRRTG